MQRLAVNTVVGLAVGSLVLGCPGDNQAPPAKVAVPLTYHRSVDLLFVVDNSGSMAGKQAALAAGFPKLLDRLATVEGGLPDLHVGVVSTNVGTGGVNIGGCSSPGRPMGDDGNLLTNQCAGVTEAFLSDAKQADGSRVTNYTGDLAAVLGCMVKLGTTGCGFEQPLEALDRALRPDRNQGFLRPDAHLAIVLFSDEDDCSALDGGALFGDPNGTITSPLGARTSFRCFEFGVSCANDQNPRAFGHRTGCVPRVGSPYMKDVSSYVDHVKALATASRHVIVAGLTGPVDGQQSADVIPDPDDPSRPAVGASCTGAVGSATPAIRSQAFVGAFADRNVTTSICHDDLTDAMAAIATIIEVAIGSPCIDRALADRDPNTAGVQPECAVADVLDPDEPATRMETVIPACDASGSAPPCWRLVPDADQCPDADHLSIVVDRGGASVPLGTVLEVQCVTD